MGDDFPEPVKRRLAARAGNVCSNPVCLQTTSGPSDTDKGVTNVGEAAHIAGARPGSARYDPTMTPEQRSSIDNGIWHCSKCAKMIDDDAIRYQTVLLHSWKKAAEQRARDLVGRGPRQQQTPPQVVAGVYLGPNALNISGTNAVNIGPNGIVVNGPHTHAPAGPKPLSQEAIELICAGAANKQGAIFAVQMLHGYDVKVGDRDFLEPRSARTEARWRGVVHELATARLIEPGNAKREWYRVTDAGYRLVDSLEKDPHAR